MTGFIARNFNPQVSMKLPLMFVAGLATSPLLIWGAVEFWWRFIA